MIIIRGKGATHRSIAGKSMPFFNFMNSWPSYISLTNDLHFYSWIELVTSKDEVQESYLHLIAKRIMNRRCSMYMQLKKESKTSFCTSVVNLKFITAITYSERNTVSQPAASTSRFPKFSCTKQEKYINKDHRNVQTNNSSNT